MTRSAVSSLTSPRVSALSARETVPGCTRAARATSRRVTGPPDAIGADYADVCSGRGRRCARKHLLPLRGRAARSPLLRPPCDGVPVPRPPVRGPVPGRAAGAPAVPDRRPPLVLRAGLGARARGDRVVLDRPAAVRTPLRRALAAVAAARRRRARGGRQRARGRRGQLRRDAGGRRRERTRRRRLPP